MWIAGFSRDSDYLLQLQDLPFSLCHANKKSQEFYNSSFCAMCIGTYMVQLKCQTGDLRWLQGMKYEGLTVSIQVNSWWEGGQ